MVLFCKRRRQPTVCPDGILGGITLPGMLWRLATPLRLEWRYLECAAVVLGPYENSKPIRE